jgi:hypothetical protein
MTSFDLIQILPYIFIGALIISLILLWLTRREAKRTFEELAYSPVTTQKVKDE